MATIVTKNGTITTSGSLDIITSGSNHLYISSSGNVGIGTGIIADAKLHVHGNISASSVTASLLGTATNAVSASYLSGSTAIVNTLTASKVAINVKPDGGTYLLTANSLKIGDVSNYRNNTTSEVAIGASGDYPSLTVLQVDNGGYNGYIFNVCDMYGNVKLGVPSVGGVAISPLTTTDITFTGAAYYQLKNTNFDWEIFNQSSGKTHLYITRSTDPNMDGNIGINTRSPQAQLHVNGVVSASAFSASGDIKSATNIRGQTITSDNDITITAGNLMVPSSYAVRWANARIAAYNDDRLDFLNSDASGYADISCSVITASAILAPKISASSALLDNGTLVINNHADNAAPTSIRLDNSGSGVNTGNKIGFRFGSIENNYNGTIYKTFGIAVNTMSIANDAFSFVDSTNGGFTLNKSGIRYDTAGDIQYYSAAGSGKKLTYKMPGNIEFIQYDNSLGFTTSSVFNQNGDVWHRGSISASSVTASAMQATRFIGTASLATTASYALNDGTGGSTVSASWASRSLSSSYSDVATNLLYSDITTFHLLIGAGAGGTIPKNDVLDGDTTIIGQNAANLADNAQYASIFGNAAAYASSYIPSATIMGSAAGYVLVTGSYATIIGREAGYYTGLGEGVTMVGGRAGYYSQTASNSTFIGYNADVVSGSQYITKSIAIGYNAKVSSSNTCILGGTGSDAVKVGIGTYNPLTTLHVMGNISASSFSASGYRIHPNMTLDSNGLDLAGSCKVLSSGYASFADANVVITPDGYLTALQISSSLITGSMRGRLIGTASYADNALSASYATTASYALNGGGQGVTSGGSYNISASYASQSLSSSYVSGSTSVLNNLDIVNTLVFTNPTSRIIIGEGAGTNHTSNYSVQIGFSAGNDSNGLSTVQIGDGAGQLSTVANTAVQIGKSAGYGATAATNAVHIGAAAGYFAAIGNNSTFIGSNADAVSSITNVEKSIGIGYNAKVGGSNMCVLGGTGSDAVNVGIGTFTPQTTLHVMGNISASSVTASLQGTASWAISASYAPSTPSDTAVSASWASSSISSSYALTSSYAIRSLNTGSTYPVTASYAVTATTAKGTTSGLDNNNKIIWTAGTLTFVSGAVGSIGLCELIPGGSCIVKLTIQGDDDNNGIPYAYYGEYMITHHYQGTSPHPGYIMREITTPGLMNSASLIDPGFGDIKKFTASFSPAIGFTGGYLMETWMFYGRGTIV